MKNLAELARKNRNQQKKDSRRKVILTIVLSLIVVLTAVAIVFAVTYFKKNEPEPANYQPTATTDPSASTVPVDPDSEITVLYLQSGNYTAGTDIPSGTYDIEVIYGSGSVYSDNYGYGKINLYMGINEDAYTASSFTNMVLNDGDTLTISGPSLKLTSYDASTEELLGREPWAEEGYTLTSGNYRVGRDFEPGVYDILYNDGDGSFDFENEKDGLYGYYWFNTDKDYGITAFYHCYLSDGTEISVSGIKVDIYPSGLVPVDYYTPIEP